MVLAPNWQLKLRHRGWVQLVVGGCKTMASLVLRVNLALQGCQGCGQATPCTHPKPSIPHPDPGAPSEPLLRGGGIQAPGAVMENPGEKGAVVAATPSRGLQFPMAWDMRAIDRGQTERG